MSKPILVPAIRVSVHGQLYVGKPGDSHSDIEHRYKVNAYDDAQNGFVLEGDDVFLTRTEAATWLQRIDPTLWADVKDQVDPAIGLHSHHLSPNVDVSTKDLLFVDRGGLYTYMAQELGKHYRKVWYHLLDSSPYKQSNLSDIGTGLPEIQRVDELEPYLEKADITYFPDIYDGGRQHWLRTKGYRVFGSGRSDRIELDKIWFLDVLEEAGLPVPDTELVHGTDELLSFLRHKKPEEWWIKSLWRGDFETKKYTGIRQLTNWIEQDLIPRIGSRAKTLPFLVQAKIESACEAGYDGFCVDGSYTSAILGYEIKDQGLVAKVNTGPTPDILDRVNTAMGPYYRDLGYRGHYSTEIRITAKGEPYFIDPTCRIPSPPGELFPRLYKNYASAVWQIACGLVPTLIPAAKYGAEVVLISPFGEKKEICVEYPSSISDNLMFKSHCRRSGTTHCIPGTPGTSGYFCCVVVVGDDWHSCAEEAMEVVKEVQTEDLEYEENLFKEAEKAIEAGERFGISFK
jgi:hypothetical protein